MIKIKHICVQDVLDNSHLLDAYAEESKNSIVPEHDPDVEVYMSLEQSGALKVFGAYEGSDLVGFISVTYTVLPHYSSLSGRIESFFVLKEHRKFGTGKRLIKAVEKQAKSMGCQSLHLSAPVGGDLSKAARLFGYTNTSLLFMKELV